MVKLKDMATTIYKNKFIHLLDGTEIEIMPLKIKYLREVMDTFMKPRESSTDDEMIQVMVECTRISMKQYCPEISKSVENIEDNFVLDQLYDILDIGAGIKITKQQNDGSEEKPSNKPADAEAPTWNELDLAKLEAEVFLLGIWKDYNELEKSLSMPELLKTLESKRDLDYQEKKFLAAIQGVDLEENSDKGQREWEDMKARVFSGGATSDSNDILAWQGANAQKVGFGIGMGLDYDDNRDPSVML